MIAALATATLALSGCQTDGMGDKVRSAGSAVGSAASNAAGAVTSGIPSLVNVDLSNVLNNLAVDLHLDRANVPINAQIPITLAANVCGVSINILSVSTGGQANCTAKTASPELAQVVQQQIAAGGNVGGGAQGGSTATNPGTTATGGTAASGSTGTTGTSTGATTTSGTIPPATGTTSATTTTTPPRN
ncbi:hypothetical protein HMF7854_08895 [Sphingomonas ginkgonis]|uniref:Uncharacterized protein n=2 Tax=Sphingomonas ginkgonis TaxID=2315330 RepID=A0A3S0EMH4_9SPHN|nr:hypothetical protein HMF7854_08895 [Sphingomonas ginkgonis]